MVELIISVLITLGTVVPGTNTNKKVTSTSTSTPTTVITNGGTSTWTNGGLE